jgi:hypothetical protein
MWDDLTNRQDKRLLLVALLPNYLVELCRPRLVDHAMSGLAHLYAIVRNIDTTQLSSLL